MTAALKVAGLAQLRETLARTGGASIAANADAAVARQSAGASAEDSLRLALAVRGWCSPSELLAQGSSEAGAEPLLAALATDVETAASARPGEWFLSVSARTRSLLASDPRQIADALRPQARGDEADPMLWAFRQAMSGAELPDLARQDEARLRALAKAREWLGPLWNPDLSAEQIAAAIAGRTLAADLERMTSRQMVGEVHKRTLATLQDFVSAPRRGGFEAIYLHATGGGGTTTLLAFLQSALHKRKPPPAIARIDFDEPAIDPARTITLTIALVEQLAASLPQVNRRLAGALPYLRRTGSAQRGREFSGARRKGPATKAAWHQQNLNLESIVSESASDMSSVLYGLFDPGLLGGPLIIVLDTAELVLAQNDRAVAGIASWFGFLRAEAGARDIRLIVAGRDPPPAPASKGPAAGDLLSRLEQIGAQFAPPVALPGLTVDEAEKLLENCGITDEALRRSAALAVPGNPLLLRLTADALQDSEIAKSAREAHQGAKIDKVSARNYLMRRVIAHVADPATRPYVIAAMASPILTRPMLRDAIMPMVENDPAFVGSVVADRDRARWIKRIFAGLAATHWLGRASLDGNRLVFNRDLRGFVLELVAASPEHGRLHAVLHDELHRFHAARKGTEDRVLAAYHAALLGLQWTLPRSGGAAQRILRDVFDELPPAMQRQLQGTARKAGADPNQRATRGQRDQRDGGSPGGAATAVGGPGAPPGGYSEQEWRLYLEGVSGKPGQGDSLVGDDKAQEALDLYRSRPTRASGLPPTFVIQALADLGEWKATDVNVPALVKEVQTELSGRSNLPPEMIARVYWLTRLGLFVGEGRLPPPHLSLLEEVSQRAGGTGLSMLPALVAVAEAASGKVLTSSRMARSARGGDAQGRLLLARGQSAKAELPAAQIVVVQRDWLNRISHSSLKVNTGQLSWIQKHLDDLNGQPLAAVNHAFADFSRPVSLFWDGANREDAILAFRGQTVEFLRPLREGLWRASQQPEAAKAIHLAVSKTIAAMSIRPRELEQSSFDSRSMANPRAWFTALVNFSDRCRLLPLLCGELARMPEAGTVARIARSYLAWDKALCGGRSSQWTPPA